MIPDWNGQGVLPPIRPGAGGSSADRSPYRVSLQQLVTTFAISPERVTILRGFLDYRAALHAAGIIVGFQWVDGSFVENIEALEGRQPNDMDVVTLCYLPDTADMRTLVANYPHLFHSELSKERFHVDAYVRPLDDNMSPPLLVRLVTYWYSMWSHTRGGLWKGFIEVDLNPAEDTRARAVLNGEIQR